jgi:uncharacterized UBP type Zn finger protein
MMFLLMNYREPTKESEEAIKVRIQSKEGIQNTRSIQEGIQNLLTTEEFERHCTQCNTNIALRTTKIISLPQTLSVQICHYEYNKEKGMVVKFKVNYCMYYNILTPPKI